MLHVPAILAGALNDVEAMGRVVGGTSALFLVDATGTVCADPCLVNAWGWTRPC